MEQHKFSSYMIKTKPNNGVGMLNKHSKKNRERTRVYSIKYSQYDTKFTNHNIKVKIAFHRMKVNIHICIKLNMMFH
jgi:hypothetical protein